MWLHPDGISRCTRWEKDDGNWASIANQIVESSSLTLDQVKSLFSNQLPLYQGLLNKMKSIGVDDEILDRCAYSIENICQQLEVICHG